MRPRKVILYVNPDENESSVMSYMLTTNGFRVVPAASKDEALALLKAMQIDCVLSEWSIAGHTGDEVIQALKRIAVNVPMVLLGDLKVIPEFTQWPDRILSKPLADSLHILETLRMMSARKRGPRKGFKQVTSVPAPVALAEVSA